jgi:SAM-dependent methyltransferase
VLEREWPFACVSCGRRLAAESNALRCHGCSTTYPIRDGIPLLVREESAEQKEQQAAFFDVGVNDEFEVERPSGAPPLYRWLLTEKFRRSVAHRALRGLTALAVCGGSGMDAEFLATAGARVVSSDISLGAARRARERGQRHGVPIDVIVADVEYLPFPDRSIDIVYVHDGLHHLERPLEGLAEMARVARGAVCVSEPAQAAVTRAAVRLGLALEQEEAGNRVGRLTLDEVRSTLAARGFRIVTAERYGMYYRHEPGRAVRLLSHQPLLGVTQVSFRLANALAGSLGNKLVVQGVRDQA